MKAFATLLVVAGHSIQFSNIDFDSSWIFKIIYSFHMPLFMCIAGYLFVEKDSVANEVIKKAKLLLVPFLSWSVVSYLVTNGFNSSLIGLIRHIASVIENPSLGLWFLPTLFICFSVFYLIPRNGKEAYAVAIILILYVSVRAISFLSIDILKLVAWQMPFFLVGYLIKKYSLINFFNKKLVIYLSLIVFVVFVSQWQRTSITSLFGYSLNSGITVYAASVIVRYLCAISAFIVLFGVCVKISNEATLKSVYFLANNSLSIYAVQMVILDMVIGIMQGLTKSLVIVEISSFSISIIVIVVIISAINKVRPARVVLFGR